MEMNRFHIATAILFVCLASFYLGAGTFLWSGSYLAAGVLFLWIAGIVGLSFYYRKQDRSASLFLLLYTLFLSAGIAGIVIVLPEPVLTPLNGWSVLLPNIVSLIALSSFYGFWRAKKQEQWLSLFRVALWVLSIVSIQISLLYWKGIDWDTTISLGIFTLVALVSGQKIIAFGLSSKRKQHFFYPTILAWGFSRFNPFSACFDQLERFFGIDIKGTWAIQFVRSSIEPLAIMMVSIGWFMTSLYVIHPNQSGVRENFGKPEDIVLQPGLHWKLPFPFGQIRVANTEELKQLSIGHEEEPSTEEESSAEKESILWANQHAEEEFLLLLGDGRDLISADGMLQYKITDVHAYLYQTQNPEVILRSVTYRVLMQETVSRTLEDALSENLQVLASRVNQRIVEELEGKNIGITPVLFSFSALHPPVAVAKDYQEVISAQIDKDTKVLRAEAYRLQALPKAEKEALIAQHQAKEFWASKRAEAVGEAFQFAALRQQVRQNTPLYLFRKRQENLERNLKGRDLVIIDHRLESAGAELWIQK